MAAADYYNTVQEAYIAYYGRAADKAGLDFWAGALDDAGGNLDAIIDAFANSAEYSAYLGSITDLNERLNAIYQNAFGRDGDEAGLAFWVGEIEAGNVSEAAASLAILQGAQNEDAAILANKVTVATDFTNRISASGADYDADNVNDAREIMAGVTATNGSVNAAMAKTLIFASENGGDLSNPTSFTVDQYSNAAGGVVDSLRLQGDQDVRVDFTNRADPIQRVDLDSDGVIEFNGVENQDDLTALIKADSVTPDGGDYEIVDAYARNPLNHSDSENNFLGNIYFDGTGFNGDGVSTNGNIVLGGLGSDILLGGIGNDFLAGGGVASNAATQTSTGDILEGGRNADFFFVELSRLDPSDSPAALDGGETADNTQADDNNDGDATSGNQDSDWVLLEASDDDEPVFVTMGASGDVAGSEGGFISSDADFNSGAGFADMDEIEHLDASGNLFGFLNEFNVKLGALAGQEHTSGENRGIGSTAQLRIQGSDEDNIIIAGYDNDDIAGGDGDDIIMGGNMMYAEGNSSLPGITNNGIDDIDGGAGDDHIVYEFDGGIYTGGSGNDTLWIDSQVGGIELDTDLTALVADNIIRIDLAAPNSAGQGYGGNDGLTQAQSNAATAGAVTGFENVIATGLGALDFLSAGINDPELNFTHQMNFYGADTDMHLRGGGSEANDYEEDNRLYANTGDDVIEGRAGDDQLMGGLGSDDFIFALDGDEGTDDINVIHKQADADGDQIWDGSNGQFADGTYTQDFGDSTVTTFGSSALFIANNIDNVDPATELEDVTVAAFILNITPAGETTEQSIRFEVTHNADLALVADSLQAAIDAKATEAGFEFLSSLQATYLGEQGLPGTGVTMSVTDTAGGVINQANPGDWEFAGQSPAGNFVWDVTGGGDQTQQDLDRLVFVAYEDRADAEAVDDDAETGSTVSLGENAYAQDLVVGFVTENNGQTTTFVAEQQAYDLTFTNLAVEDQVVVAVNGVQFGLTVGIDIDGTLIAGESTAAFVARLATHINDFLDDDTAAGTIAAASAGTTLTISQGEYKSIEEAVFIYTPVVTINSDDAVVDQDTANAINNSGGERAYVTISNDTSTEVQLFEFGGADDELLNEDNVLFLGNNGYDHGVVTDASMSRSVLEQAATTGGELLGSDAIVINVAQGDDISGAETAAAYAGIRDRDEDGNVDAIQVGAENMATPFGENVSVHGDDLLIGNSGDDVIRGGTGDDKFYMSGGLDDIDGGKDLYLEDILNDGQDGIVHVYNTFEAAQRDAQAEVLSIKLLNQSEDNGAVISGLFQDILVAQQALFGGVVGAGGAQFSIVLDLDTTFATGGSGQIVVSENGAQTGETWFRDMEHVRTVGGDGTLAGQGHDTLDLSRSADYTTRAFGTNNQNMTYDLTGGVNAGLVTLAGNNFMFVDGVEHVITGGGTDQLIIDETEADKNNNFTAGAGDDTITYQVNGLGAFSDYSTLDVAIGPNDVDTVTQTGGLVPETDANDPIDTLTGVENIDISAAAVSSREDDILDVSALTSGATVDFTNGDVDNGGVEVAEIGTFNDNGTPADTTDDFHTGMSELENVLGSSANDTVIISNTMANSREDVVDGTASADILFDTYLTFDLTDEGVNAALDTDSDIEQITVPELRAANELAAIPNVVNYGQFNFDLAGGTDRIDYSNETGTIAVVVNLGVEGEEQFVIVDHNNNDDLTDAGDRIDVLQNVEQIVASLDDGLAGNAEAILDFTSSTQDVQITFEYNIDDNETPADGDEYENTIRIADGDGDTIEGLNGFVERYTYGAAADAIWNVIEGSHYDEVILYEGSEDLTDQDGLDHRYSDDRLTLRGGDNNVRYNALETSITVQVNVVEDSGIGDGLITATVDFQDGDGNALTGAGTHTITSYTSDNSIQYMVDRNEDGTMEVDNGGSLKLEATQDQEDTVSFVSSSAKVFILGSSAGVLDVTIGSLDTMRLTGFERLQDADSDDVYTLANMSAGGLDLVDNTYPTNVGGNPDDSDTVDVGNDAIGFGNAGAGEISLEAINDAFAFDFDVLDIQDATTANLVLLGDDDDQDDDATLNNADTDYLGDADTDNDGDTELARDIANDELIFDDLDIVDSIQNFDVISLGVNTVLNGNALDINLTAGTISSGGDSVNLIGTDLDKVDLSRMTTGANVSVTTAAGFEVVGTQGADNISGSAGADILEGGLGADTLSGGLVSEVREFQIALPLNATNEAITIDFNGGLTLTLNEVAGAPVDTDPDTGENLDITAGSTVDQVGAALLSLIQANLDEVNAIADLYENAAGDDAQIISAAYDASNDTFTFTFTAGIDVLAADVITFADTDAQMLAGDAGTDIATTTEGGDGGSDTYVYNSAAEGGDTITGFLSTDDVIAFRDDNATDLGALIDDDVSGTINATTLADDGATSFDVENTEMVFALDTITDSGNTQLTADIVVADLTDTTKMAANLEALIGTITDGGAEATAQTIAFAVESQTAGTYGVYAWTQSSATDTTIDAAELTVIGVVTADDLATGDFALI